MSLVSVIIPIYNVEKYLLRCVDSVRSQTYRELEILLIDDGSTDTCPELCDKYARMDPRIRVIHQNNAGLGMARNKGLSEATGEYVLYVDSDDWIEDDCVEAYVTTAMEKNTDFIASNSFYQDSEKETIDIYSLPMGMYTYEEQKDSLLLGGFVSMWLIFFRRKWLIEKGLFQPNIYTYEDWGIYPCMVYMAEKIFVLNHSFYHYTFEREGSITTGSEIRLVQDFQRTIVFMINYMKNNHIWEINKSSLKYYCLRDYYVRACLNRKSKNKDAEQILEKIRRDILEREFGSFDLERKKYLVLGSFSLRWEVQKGSLVGQKTDKHYCFSSIISIFSKIGEYNVTHKNDFRKHQLEREMKSELIQELKSADKDTIFILDFLEERFNLLEMLPGVYMTESDAFCESNLKDADYIRRICNGSDEYIELWQQASDKLTALLKECLKPTQIILVRNRMSLTYGNFECASLYEEKEELDRINQRIEWMENYFCRYMPGIIQIDSNRDYCFTDPNLPYGCRPEYANNAWYAKVGFALFEKVV